MDSVRSDRDALETEVQELRARVKLQSAELETLRKQLAPSLPTRRDLLRVGGMVGAGLAAITIGGVAGATPQPAAAIEGHDLLLKGPALIYLTLKGAKQGTITGGVTARGHEGALSVQYLQQKIVSPRDPATGLPTGRRQHQPLVFRSVVDESTPALLTAFSTNETITEAHFKFFSATRTGQVVQNFTIDLQSANIVSHDLYHPDSDSSGVDGTTRESLVEIAMTYRKITWTWVDGGKTASDDWNPTT